MRKTIILVSALLGVVVIASGAAAAGQSGLAGVRQATAAFHDVGKAEDAGYGSTLGTEEEPSLGCFESGAGGMGLHYVKGPLDGAVEATAPEALVYEMRPNGKLKLVAVEYIAALPETAVPPSVLGQDLHWNPAVGLWVLHAWIWAPNPAGMYADWNPRVGMCPDGVPIFGG